MEDNSFKKTKPKKSVSTKRQCVYCGKAIKKFAKWKDNPNRKVHRKCWLKHREWEWRHFDYLFTEKVKPDTAPFAGSKLAYQSVAPVPKTDFHPHNQVLPECQTDLPVTSLPHQSNQ